MMQQITQAPQLAEIYGTWHVPFWQTSWFKLCCSAGLLVIAAVVLYGVIRTIKNRNLPATPPWQEALNQLERMAATFPQTSDETRLHYIRLTYLLKRYIQRRYDRTLTGSTDTELAEQAQEHGLPEKAADHLKQVLEGAVLIKFARAEAREAQIARDLKHACEIISLSTPKPLAPPRKSRVEKKS